MVRQMGELDFSLPDRQLACAYVNSTEGQDYLAAMACAANYAWTNRQMLMHRTRAIFTRTLGMSPRAVGMRLVYDVCHNIAKIENFPLDGKAVTLSVHRKGATRSFPPGHPTLPDRYRNIGQPALIPGDMGHGSYVLASSEKAFRETFGNTCHGAGRVMSHAQATKVSKGRAIEREMADRGVMVMAKGGSTLREELPEAYKNLNEVVDVVHQAGLARKVARLSTLGCSKG